MERILVIDDHIETLRLISLILQRNGYQVDTASSGAKGIEEAHTNLPDLVLLDIMMPEMSGLEVCRHFRATPELASVPVVMFTARAQNEDREEAYKSGANDYIVKPTRPQELLERVKGLLEKHRVNSAELSTTTYSVIAICSAIKNDALHLSLLLALNLVKRIAPTPLQLIDMTGYAQQFGVTALQLIPAVPIEKLGEVVAVHRDQSMILLNLGKCTTSDIAILAPHLHQMILFASAELDSISKTRRRIQALLTDFRPSQLHVVVVEFGDNLSITSEMLSDLLQFPVTVAFACPMELAEAISMGVGQQSTAAIDLAMGVLIEKIGLS